MKKIKIFVFTLMLLAICPSVMAKEVNHFVSKADDDIVMEDTYNSSVAVAGQDVSMDGVVKGLSALAGNKVTLNGETDYGVIAGNTITLNGTINNDAFVAGNVITSSKDSLFKRDAIIGGSDIELNGNFERNVSLYGSKITLKNVNVKGNVKVYAESITVEKGTVIEGILYYPEDSKYSASKEASIGAAEKTPAIQAEDDENYFATISAKIWSFLGLAVVFAAIALFFPGAFNKINEKYEKIELSEAVEVFTKGLVVLILVPIIAVLLIFTMIGRPLSVILLLIYGICIYLATIFSSYLLGYKIWQKVFNKEGHILLFGLIGLFIVLILELIPGVRFLISAVAILVGLGLIFDVIKGKEQK